MLRKWKTTAAAVFVAFSSTVPAAHAALVHIGANCDVTAVTLAGTNASACEGIFAGNDSNQDVSGLFGGAWTYVTKYDLDSGATSGDASVGLTADAGSSGDWSVSSWGAMTDAMVILKGGKSFSAFLLDDLTLGTSGTFDTTGAAIKGNAKKGKLKFGPDLSHISLYSRNTTPPDDNTGPDPVPLPAGGWLILTGLAALAASRRAKKA